MASSRPLRIGYVPEHFSTPLHFAHTKYSLHATLIPFPSGTGHMITSIQAGEIDIGIGLTEGWVAGLGKAAAEKREGGAGYRLAGTYVETPLRWAISTGAAREDVTAVAGLKGRKMGVSRIGSGSYVMGFVFADTQGWLESSADPPFEVVPLQTFAKLRDAVNDRTADFFMWEHFTSKRYYDNGSIKRIGEIYTPWPSWHIVASDTFLGSEQGREQLKEFYEKLNLGIKYFEGNREEAVQYISEELDYSKEDAREWLGTVTFSGDVTVVSEDVVVSTLEVLKKAGVLEGSVGVEGAGNTTEGMTSILYM